MSDKSPRKPTPQKIIQEIRKIIIDDGITDENSKEFKDEFKKRTTLSTFHQQSYQEIIDDFKNDATTIQELRDENEELRHQLEELRHQLEQKERRIHLLNTNIANNKTLIAGLNKQNDNNTETIKHLSEFLDKFNIDH